MSVAAWAAVASSIVAAVSHCVAAGSFLVAWKAWRRDELAVRRDVLRRLVGNAWSRPVKRDAPTCHCDVSSAHGFTSSCSGPSPFAMR